MISVDLDVDVQIYNKMTVLSTVEREVLRKNEVFRPSYMQKPCGQGKT